MSMLGVVLNPGERQFREHMLYHPSFQFPADCPRALLEDLAQDCRAALLPVSVAASIVVLQSHSLIPGEMASLAVHS